MAYVQTVAGKIAPEDMKKTLVHEHCLWDQRFYAPELPQEIGEAAFLTRRIRMEDLGKIRYHMHSHRDNLCQDNTDEASEEIMEYKLAGGDTLCDCSCYGIGRDPRAILRIAQSTGLHVLMGTGAYIALSHSPKIKSMGVKDLADLFIREILEGVDDTGIKAGFIGEVGISEKFPEQEKRVLEAACIAQKKTGAGLSIHQPGALEGAHEILDYVEKFGGILEKTNLCHCDATFNNPTYQDSLIKRGVFISFDQFGLEFVINLGQYKNLWLPRDFDRIMAIAAHGKRGNLSHILMSHDLSFKACYKKYGGYGYAHIIENIVPLLLHEGLTREDIDTIMIENPRRLFSIEA
jgi:phosphotriesterase-related protein